MWTASNFNKGANKDDGTCTYDACASNPCLNNAKCVSHKTQNAFKCNCMVGTSGDRCDEQITRVVAVNRTVLRGAALRGSKTRVHSKFALALHDQFGAPYVTSYMTLYPRDTA